MRDTRTKAPVEGSVFEEHDHHILRPYRGPGLRQAPNVAVERLFLGFGPPHPEGDLDDNRLRTALKTGEARVQNQTRPIQSVDDVKQIIFRYIGRRQQGLVQGGAQTGDPVIGKRLRHVEFDQGDGRLSL